MCRTAGTMVVKDHWFPSKIMIENRKEEILSLQEGEVLKIFIIDES